MPDANDMELMQEYAGRNSEPAFAELVHRHINLVYSVALRFTGDSGDAQDVTQAVFIILAQKAASLRHRTSLTGWLYETTRLTARQALRTRIRRQAREQEAYMQSTLNDPDPGDAWRQLAPLLEEAMARLNEKERTLLALRFFENKTGAETAALLGIREWAAHKRAERAVEKLRAFFTQRGIVLPAAVMTAAISANSVQAAPVALAKSVTAVAIAKGAAASGSTLTLIKGALKIMAWTKAKTAIVVGAVVLLAAGTTTVTIKEVQEHRTYPWQIAGNDSRVLDRQPPQIRILSSKIKYGSWGRSTDKNGNTKLMGTGVSAETVVLNAYDFSYPTRVVGSDKLPDGKFDYIASLTMGNHEALQKESKEKFGVIARVQTRESDVLLLTVKLPNAQGLRPSKTQNGSTQKNSSNQFSCVNQPVSYVAGMLEDKLQIPVIDQTGLTQNFDIDLRWNQNDPQHNSLKQALTDQLGLELVPTNIPIEMLVVEKAK